MNSAPKILSLQNYVRFDGRIGRQHYIQSVLILMFITLLFRYVVGSLYYGMPMILPHNITDESAFRAVLKSKTIGDSISSLVLLGPMSSVVARRLHDRSWSGWLNLLWIFSTATYFGLWFAEINSVAALNDQGFWERKSTLVSHLDGLVAGVIQIFFTIELWFRRGTDGPNRFGPDPLAGK